MNRESDTIMVYAFLVSPNFVEDVVEEFSPVAMTFSMASYHMIIAKALIPCDFRDYQRKNIIKEEYFHYINLEIVGMTTSDYIVIVEW